MASTQASPPSSEAVRSTEAATLGGEAAVVAAGRPTADKPTPLPSVLTFTFLNSMGSGLVSNGIFFIAKETFGFSKAQCFGLGVAYGLTYIPAAMGVGPLVRRLRAGGTLSGRGVLCVLMAGMGGACMLPALSLAMNGAAKPSAWALWMLMLVYAGLSGMLWPMVEAYLSGGRRGKVLRTGTGRFNITWSSALVLAMLLVAPYTKEGAVEALAALGVLHWLSCVILVDFSPSPAAHEEEEHEPHAPVYAEQLAIFRWVLATAYLVLNALLPYIAVVADTLGLGATAAVVLGASWPAARVAGFIFMERWHGWHGRRSMPWVGCGMLLGGFALVVLLPVLLPQTWALAGVVLGLIVFGAAMGVIYAATLYYTMSVGAAQVEAGGSFETLIGLGYLIGPLSGLATVWWWADKEGGSGHIETTMLVLVSVLMLGGVAMALRAAGAQAKASGGGRDV
ncbi:MAG: MFS transporter [Phycisphaerales bacterium]